MATVNWAKLVAQGRVKSIGIPWTPEEASAIYKLKIPVDYVRNGVLTLEDYEKAQKEGTVKTVSGDELKKEAKELGISFTPEATAEVLEKEIEAKKAIVEAVPKKKKMIRKKK